MKKPFTVTDRDIDIENANKFQAGLTAMTQFM